MSSQFRLVGTLAAFTALFFVFLQVTSDGWKIRIWRRREQAVFKEIVPPPSDYVNNFIGTTNGGHVFSGATLPFGSVKAGPDCSSGETQAGYVTEGCLSIVGFSQLHDDGTGGSSSLGNFKLLPQYCKLSECNTNVWSRAAAEIADSRNAQPGYFSIGLKTGIKAEMTVTAHTALHRYTYTLTNSTSPATILLDLTNDLQHSYRGGGALNITTIKPPTLNLTTSASGGDATRRDHGVGEHTRVTGGGTWIPSFGQGSYKVYFCLDVPGVLGTAYYDMKGVHPFNESIAIPSDQIADTGALLTLDPEYLKAHGNAVQARIAVSWTSPEKACAYAEEEMPTFEESADFTKYWLQANAAWNDVLGTVELDTHGADMGVVTGFWSALYRSYIAPINVTGDNPFWDSTEPYFDSYYCIWDSFRTVHPLYAITARDAQAQMVRALIDVWRNEGFLPDCRMSFDKGFTQGGSNADSVLSDSYVKGITTGINWEDALQAAIKDATVTPPDWGVEGRGGIENRKKLGYVPVDDDTPLGTIGRSASRTLEYAFNDFSIALIAQGLNKTDIATEYIKASGDWINLWNPNVVDPVGYSGFIQPRYKNGSWMDVDPRRCSPVFDHLGCFLQPGSSEFYEAASWEYSYFVPHDMAKVVTLMGGPLTFIKRLDTFFEQKFHDIGDEPGFLPCFLYNYAGRPDKTVDRVLQVLKDNFSATLGGLPGNDDSGAMGGFVVFGSFGFYPVAGTSVYLISTPLFPSIAIRDTDPAAKGRMTRIKTVNFDGAKVNKYVQNATLNGKPFTRNWFAHDELFGVGGTLELTLGPTPSEWGTKVEDLPPSLSTGGRFDGML